MFYLHFIPVATSILSTIFFIVLANHWLKNSKAMHIFWWMIGVLFFALGTITESINTIYGFSNINFKLWYIFGALLGAAPLAQGTVYLFILRTYANKMSWILCVVIVIVSILVLLSPLKPIHTLDLRLNGSILQWGFIRYVTPIINVYGLVFLVGGAIYSAYKFSKSNAYRSRFYGNLCIAIGGLLPAMGGIFAKFGYIMVLYVTEFNGIVLIYLGYLIIRKDILRVA